MMKTIDDYKQYFCPFEDDFKGLVTDDIYAKVERDDDHPCPAGAVLKVECNDYEPAEGEQWDAEAWEDRNVYISAPLEWVDARLCWRRIYRLARILVKNGKATLQDSAGKLYTLQPPEANQVEINFIG